MSTFGNSIKISLFGESHGETIGITIHNFPCNIRIDEKKIERRLILRRGLNSISTQRREKDQYKIVSGYFNNVTTGAPLTILISNEDVNSKSYDNIKNCPRPSHADFPAYKKYEGCYDYRGGGHFSGRLTTLLVILGSLCEDALIEHHYDIKVVSRIKSIYNIVDDSDFDESLKEDVFPVVNKSVKEKMKNIIETFKKEKNSLGGVVETKIYGLDVGLGEPYFDSFESIVSHLVFSIGGVKGIEFGSGFDISKMSGKDANDQFIVDNGIVNFKTNHSGGINGGITNGNTICFKTAIKPTPSIGIIQKSFNYETLEEEDLEIVGRHDPIIAIKALHVINALMYYACLEMIMEARKWH